jgi:hypothetical protein
MKWLFAVVLLVLPAHAADLSGIWTGHITGRDGQPQDLAFQFQHDGASKLTGKLYGDYKSMPIVEAKAAGDLITFVVLAEEQAGNQINQTRVRYTGRLNGDTLELFRERERSTIAGNSGYAHIREEVKVLVRLKRLL